MGAVRILRDLINFGMRDWRRTVRRVGEGLDIQKGGWVSGGERRGLVRQKTGDY